MIFSCLEAGEDVVVKSDHATAVKPAVSVLSPDESRVYLDRSGKPHVSAPSVINKSVVFHRPLAPKPAISQAELDELYEDMRGTY